MSFKLSELLNPVPTSGSPSSQPTELQDSSLDASIQRAMMNSTGLLPPHPPVLATELDLPIPHSLGNNHITPVEPSASLEQSSSSPTLDQYHLSFTQDQARRQSSAHTPHSPLPTLAPIQPQYDVSPPGNPHEVAEEYRVVENTLPHMRAVDVESSQGDMVLPISTSQEVPSQDLGNHDQGRDVEDGPIPGCKVSEKEIAALGLAALDGVQDEAQEADERVSALKTEAQGAPDLAVVPASKSVNRPHKVSSAKPSEGSSDKRFLCYICIKLFTRRRSVRDHIKKIHNDNNFDMARAIEVTVDPDTGESLIPLSELVKTLPSSSGSQQAQNSTSKSVSRASSVETNTFSTPAPIAGKKRPAAEMGPAQATALKKKGTAKPKPLNTSTKKVKPEIESSAEVALASRSLSGTPVSSRASKPPAPIKPKKQPSMSLVSSPAPSDRMSIAPASEPETEDEDEPEYVPAEEAGENLVENEAGDDSEVFCICRKGDNHTWMIGCDGGCEDWFHGKCVHIQERDGDLIDKYICPNCEDKGRGQTTWKRMCRRKECRKPARVLADPPSKYCTEECKKRFWVEMVQKSDPNAIVSEDGLMVIGSKVYQRSEERKKRQRRKVKEDEEYHDTHNEEESDFRRGVKLSPSQRKKKATSPILTKTRKKDSLEQDAISSDDEPPLPTNGGQLTIGDIKMILNQSKTVEEIRQLGQKPPTPPYTSDIDADDANTTMIDGIDAASPQDPKIFPYNSEEQENLERLSSRRKQLNERLQSLRDQDKLFAMIRSRSTAIIDEMDVPKAKNVCGFDARLSWSTAEFEDWRGSPMGRMALEKNVIGDPDPGQDSIKQEKLDDLLVDAMGKDRYHEDHPDGDEDAEDGDDNTTQRQTTLRGICIRNKCPRHREWRRLLASEYKFEEEVVRRQLRKVEAESKEVRERAAMRVLCEQE